MLGITFNFVTFAASQRQCLAKTKGSEIVAIVPAFRLFFVSFTLRQYCWRCDLLRLQAKLNKQKILEISNKSLKTSYFIVSTMFTTWLAYF
jgi:hypothetical protein